MATVTATQPIPALPLPSPDAVYRLSVSQFDRMVRDGTLDEDEPVELLNGVLVTKMPKNPRHRVGTRKVVRALEGVIPAGWFAQKEDSLIIPPSNKWEPDVAVVRGELEFDTTRDPTASRLLPGGGGCRHRSASCSDGKAPRLRQGRDSRLLDHQPQWGKPARVGLGRGLHRPRSLHGPVSVSGGTLPGR